MLICPTCKYAVIELSLRVQYLTHLLVNFFWGLLCRYTKVWQLKGPTPNSEPQESI